MSLLYKILKKIFIFILLTSFIINNHTYIYCSTQNIEFSETNKIAVSTYMNDPWGGDFILLTETIENLLIKFKQNKISYLKTVEIIQYFYEIMGDNKDDLVKCLDILKQFNHELEKDIETLLTMFLEDNYGDYRKSEEIVDMVVSLAAEVKNRALEQAVTEDEDHLGLSLETILFLFMARGFVLTQVDKTLEKYPKYVVLYRENGTYFVLKKSKINLGFFRHYFDEARSWISYLSRSLICDAPTKERCYSILGTDRVLELNDIFTLVKFFKGNMIFVYKDEEIEGVAPNLSIELLKGIAEKRRHYLRYEKDLDIFSRTHDRINQIEDSFLYKLIEAGMFVYENLEFAIEHPIYFLGKTIFDYTWDSLIWSKIKEDYLLGNTAKQILERKRIFDAENKIRSNVFDLLLESEFVKALLFLGTTVGVASLESMENVRIRKHLQTCLYSLNQFESIIPIVIEYFNGEVKEVIEAGVTNESWQDSRLLYWGGCLIKIAELIGEGSEFVESLLDSENPEVHSSNLFRYVDNLGKAA